jgi:hypothetical protein
VVQFDATYIKTDEVRPLAGEVMYAGTGIGIGAVREALPAGAIDYIILVTKENSRFGRLTSREKDERQKYNVRFMYEGK